MSPEIILPVSEKEYNEAGSKFVNMGGKQEIWLDIEVGMPNWDTPGKSIKFPVTVTEDILGNKDKQDKLSAGVSADGVWKFKDTYRAITGKDIEIKKGKPVFDPGACAGKPAVGYWKLKKGTKGGVVGAEETTYAKLEAIYPAGQKPTGKQAEF
jgi:hypothetical protein